MPLAVGNYWEYENTYLDVIKDTLLYEVTEEIQIPIGDTTYTAYAMNFIPLPPVYLLIIGYEEMMKKVFF